MTDRPDFLDDLEQQLLEGIPIARRRRARRRGAIAGVGALLLAGGVAWAVAAQDDNDEQPVIATETSTSTVPASTTSAPATTTTEPPPTPTGAAELAVDAVSAGPDGVVLRRADDPNNAVVITDQPARKAVVFESGLVAYQLVEDPAITIWTSESRRLEPEPGWSLRLYDGATIDGTDTLLVTTETAQPPGPEDAEERLQLIEIESGAPTDLGLVGGWESGVLDARLFPDSIALLQAEGENQWLRAINYAGAELYGSDASFDRRAIVADPQHNLWELLAGFVGDDFTPALSAVQRDPITGDQLASIDEQPIELAGTAAGDGFCLSADFRSGTLLCDRSSGTPVAIDIDTGTSMLVDGFDSGAITTMLPVFGAPATEPEAAPTTTTRECTDHPSPPNEVLVIGDFDVDLDGTDDLSLVAFQEADEWLVQGLLSGASPTAPVSLGGENADFAQPAGTVDLDGDGLGELVLTGFGNTARRVLFLTFDGCDVHLVTDGVTETPFSPIIGAGGNSCAPTGCWIRTRCVDRAEGRILEITDVGPAGPIDFENLPPPEEVEMRVHTAEYQLDGTAMTLVGESDALYDGTDDLPADAPTPNDSDRIDC